MTLVKWVPVRAETVLVIDLAMRYGWADGVVCYAVNVVMHDLRTHHLYLCVGSTAPSLDILLFAINLMSLDPVIQE